MLTPVSQAGVGLVRATLIIEEPKVDTASIPLRFNPTEYQIEKSNTFAEIAIPGLETPPIQFIRGTSEKLSAELLVDTSDTLQDVRTTYVDGIRNLMRLNTELHAPPIVRLVWGSENFRGVLESLKTTYTLFSSSGIPLRAKLVVTIKEYRPVEIQVRERPTASPDFEKTYVVRAGDSLSSIAGAVYRDPSVWREIARANEITDPRSLQAGRVLTLPRLR